MTFKTDARCSKHNFEVSTVFRPMMVGHTGPLRLVQQEFRKSEENRTQNLVQDTTYFGFGSCCNLTHQSLRQECDLHCS